MIIMSVWVECMIPVWSTVGLGIVLLLLGSLLSRAREAIDDLDEDMARYTHMRPTCKTNCYCCLSHLLSALLSLLLLATTLALLLSGVWIFGPVNVCTYTYGNTQDFFPASLEVYFPFIFIATAILQFFYNTVFSLGETLIRCFTGLDADKGASDETQASISMSPSQSSSQKDNILEAPFLHNDKEDSKSSSSGHRVPKRIGVMWMIKDALYGSSEMETPVEDVKAENIDVEQRKIVTIPLIDSELRKKLWHTQTKKERISWLHFQITNKKYTFKEGSFVRSGVDYDPRWDELAETHGLRIYGNEPTRKLVQLSPCTKVLLILLEIAVMFVPQLVRFVMGASFADLFGFTFDSTMISVVNSVMLLAYVWYLLIFYDNCIDGLLHVRSMAEVLLAHVKNDKKVAALPPTSTQREVQSWHARDFHAGMRVIRATMTKNHGMQRQRTIGFLFLLSVVFSIFWFVCFYTHENVWTHPEFYPYLVLALFSTALAYLLISVASDVETKLVEAVEIATHDMYGHLNGEYNEEYLAVDTDSLHYVTFWKTEPLGIPMKLLGNKIHIGNSALSYIKTFIGTQVLSVAFPYIIDILESFR